MTHTLHRLGSEEDLKEDYVIMFMPAKGVNFEGSEEKMQKIWEVLSHYEDNLTNFGNSAIGNRLRTTMEILKQSKSEFAHAVFKDRETLKASLQEVKDQDFGISVVISGCYDEVAKICDEVGLRPHTVQHSLGIFGNTEKLPDEDLLEITTMCGHGMVSPNLVKRLSKEVNEGKRSFEEAAGELCRICDCGVFNSHRAERLLRRLCGRTDTSYQHISQGNNSKCQSPPI